LKRRIGGVPAGYGVAGEIVIAAVARRAVGIPGFLDQPVHVIVFPADLHFAEGRAGGAVVALLDDRGTLAVALKREGLIENLVNSQRLAQFASTLIGHEIRQSSRTETA
jgi:hypothetical protein